MTAKAMRPIILIAGPTASGKSALALNIAERLGGAVVNADSMQVYRDLRLLTSRPSPEDEARAPHFGYGIRDGASAYSVADYLSDVGALLAREPDMPLVFAGGTPLYIEALVRGLSDVPPVPEEVRAYWRARGLSEPPESLHAELAVRDPAMAAQLRPSDPQRILRALEVIDATGVSLADWQNRPGKPLIPAPAQCVVLQLERPDLRDRIAQRFHRMMKEGALGEVQDLKARALDPALPVMKAIGVPPLLAHLENAFSLEAAVERAITDTRQYAKRQETWFRNRLAAWPKMGPEQAVASFSRL